jgi:hypothetical protein
LSSGQEGKCVRYLLLLLLLSLPLLAQEASEVFPEAPSHPFLQRANEIRLGILAGLIAADGITTQHILNVDHGSELNPIVRPLVTKGAPGQAAASALGYAFSVGSSYMFHRTGHHRLERLMLHTSIAIEAECVTSNLIQIGKARP